MQIAGCQPDSGNPTVRDERGAYGNVSYGGIRNPLHKLKRCMSETLCLRLRAPYFYPTILSVSLFAILSSTYIAPFRSLSSILFTFQRHPSTAICCSPLRL